MPYRWAGNLLFLSGQGPKRADGGFETGRLGRDTTVETAYDHARLTGLNLLAVAKSALGELSRVDAVIKLLGMVNAEPHFSDHPRVINGCSDLLVEVFGEPGRHARSAVGMGSLPHGMTVEIEAILLVGSWGNPKPQNRFSPIDLATRWIVADASKCCSSRALMASCPGRAGIEIRTPVLSLGPSFASVGLLKRAVPSPANAWTNRAGPPAGLRNGLAQPPQLPDFHLETDHPVLHVPARILLGRDRSVGVHLEGDSDFLLRDPANANIVSRSRCGMCSRKCPHGKTRCTRDLSRARSKRCPAPRSPWSKSRSGIKPCRRDSSSREGWRAVPAS